MENNSKHRVSGWFLPPLVSCQCKTASDIVKNTIPVTQNHQNAHHIKPRSSNTIPIHTPKPKPPQTVIKKFMKERPKQSYIKNSPSSNGGWFSTEQEEETFPSLSSDTSRSFRRQTPKNPRRRGCTEIHEVGHFPFNVPSNSTHVFSPSGSLHWETAKSQQKTRECSRRTKVGSSELATEREAQESLYESTSSTDLHRRRFRRNTTKTKRRTGQNQFFTHSEVQQSLKSPANPTDIYYGSCSRNTTKYRRKTRRRRGVGECPVNRDGRVEESYAMAKTSCDPYSDFRVSMVEMIVEKHIFGTEDLERLLKCFLFLNLPYHHKVILQVFSEICQALFTDQFY